MRILLDKSSKIKLLNCLKKKYCAKDLKELSIKINKPYYTIKKWFYNKNRYLDENIITKRTRLNIIDKKEDNWGQIKGGKITYKVLVKRYGLDEIRYRQSKGGKKSLLLREDESSKNFKVNINNPLFLEFYGALLGDGWLSVLSYNYGGEKRNLWWVGISGHRILDKDYLLFMRQTARKLFGKTMIIKYKKNSKAMEILMCHKRLIMFLNKNMNFPIGKKIDLKIKEDVAKDNQKMKYVVRGIFDTDGYLGIRLGKHKLYGRINITMKAPRLLQQVERYLKNRGFEPKLNQYRLNLYGIKQTRKWMKEIGSSNKKHLKEYKTSIMSS
ncbi:LAGLIDADG family homing endonuclease [Candidatus Woesearchaeota archaeon]|nr:LAGLIDADG family homing endonuclease [Candidatus Woesearchaeota archaeon]